MDGLIRQFRRDGSSVLTLAARREAFPALKEWLNAIAAELALPARVGNQLLVAADEVFTNIASYGYPAGDGTVEVKAAFDRVRSELSLEFADSGIPHDPLATPPPDLTRPPAERKIGGLGVFMVKKLMDSVEYRRDGNRNLLTVTKKVPPRS